MSQRCYWTLLFHPFQNCFSVGELMYSIRYLWYKPPEACVSLNSLQYAAITSQTKVPVTYMQYVWKKNLHTVLYVVYIYLGQYEIIGIPLPLGLAALNCATPYVLPFARGASRTSLSSYWGSACLSSLLEMASEDWGLSSRGNRWK